MKIQSKQNLKQLGKAVKELVTLNIFLSNEIP